MKLLINLHDLVEISIETTSHYAYKFFLAEYAHHLTEESKVNIPKVVLRFQENSVISPPQGFVFHVHKGLARWAYKLIINDRRIEIDVIGNKMSISMVHHMLVHAAVRVLTSFGDTLMLHAGAIVKNDYSFIFTGSGGTGKTTTTSLLLANGSDWSLHADDYVFISLKPEKRSLAYLTRAHLYHDLLFWVPEIRSRLTTFEITRLEVFSFIRVWSKEKLKWPTRLDLKRLWPDHAFSFDAIPAGLFILKRGDIASPQIVPLEFEASMLDALVEMNFNEARHFIKLLRKSNAISDVDTWLSEWVSRERHTLSLVMQQFPLYELCLPKQFTRQDFDISVPELVNSLC